MIPAIQELNFPKIDGKQYATLTHATVNLADMGEKTISTQVKIDGDIVPDFSQDWEVAFQGEKYIMPLRQPQGAKENTSLNSTIDLTFQHWAIYQLKRWMFFTVQPVETGTAVADKYIADVILNLGDFCNLFGQVLRRYYGDTITIDLNDDPDTGWQYKKEATLISINHSYIWDVLIRLYELFAVRWSIEPNGDSSHYVIKVGYPAEELDHIFEYGFEGGLLIVERQVQSEDIRNMLLGRGGEKNIPKYYFKKSPDEEKWRSDPDWIEELANIYFTNLMGATFRSYVQGWKAAHISKYPGYAAVGESNAYVLWAYRKGYTDSKFDPVEYVKDDEGISKYGPLLGGLDNNEEIYPSIQGSGMDVAVDVEQIESDDVVESVENDAKLSDAEKCSFTAPSVAPMEYRTVILPKTPLKVDFGKKANFIDNTKILRVGLPQRPGSGASRPHNPTLDIDTHAELKSVTVRVFDAITNEERSASGIPSGNYYYEIAAQIHNRTTDKTLNITVGTESPKLQDATLGNDSWKNTFDIWVKNIWETSKLSTETNEQYAERVWKPILGDRDKNTAKVVFTSGALAISEDYEFTIVDFPQLDTSKSFGGESSHWRIKLAKSDADLESTGLYVPSTQRQGKAGDKFVFIGTEMTHHYVVWAETALDDWKKDQLREKKNIKPTWVVTTDRVRLNNEGKANALIQKLRIGNSLRLADKRFIQPIGDRAYETLYLQSITYTYREPSSDDAALNPDVTIVLSNEYATTANPVATMQGEISALQRQVGSISNVEQIVRAVGDRLYLRKDGISDRSLSPTQFFSLLTSGDFRSGIIGGAGWGFFKDENGNWVLEADRVNVRQEMQVNTLVINQAEGRGGMEIDTAAFMEVTRVVETPDDYVCYFDQKNGSVANLFHIDDVAYCNRWTPENTELKFYKRRVIAVGVDNITLSKTDVNGTGIPAEKDNIIHFGNYTDKTRQYVKVRDVVGGGYERYIENLDFVNAEGVEYYFVGKQAGESRWFVGNKDLVPYSGKGDGSYIEYINRRFNLNNVTLSVNTTIGDQSLADYIQQVSPPVKQEDIEGFVDAIVDPKIGNLQDQIDGVIETWFYNGVPTLGNYPANDWNTDALKIQHLGDLYYDNNTGTAYRFSQKDDGAYYWNTITDDAITKALAAAQKAQDTADGKRKVFTSQPTANDEYDAGDLWVNATYAPDYKNDILRAIKHKDKGAAFNIAHWTPASKYTDDSALNTFIAGYQTMISDIQTQIDGKAQTWRQPTNPQGSAEWKGADADHKGDLWYCTADIPNTPYKKGTTWYFNGTAWEEQPVPDTVFDEIDGKSSIFVSKPTTGYNERDLWFLEADYTLSGVQYKSGTLVVAKNDMGASWSADDWTKKDRYTDDTLAQQAKDAAAAAQTAADNAAKSVTNLNNYVDGAFKDGIISESEAAGIANYINIINADKERIKGTYDKLYANAYLTGTAKSGLKTAYDDVTAKINALITAINNAIADGEITDTERTAVDNAFAAFNIANGTFGTAVETANEAIQNALKDYADRAASNAVADYEYLKKAFKDVTTITGGLMLSGIVRLGENNSDPAKQTVWSGLNGIYDPLLQGRTPSYWAGGDMVDLFKLDAHGNEVWKTAAELGSGVRPAKSLTRMDGSGYLAGGNIRWDKLGNPILGSGVKITLSNGDKGLSETLNSINEFMQGLRGLFAPADENGNELAWSAVDTAATIKAKKTLFSVGDLQAFGASAVEGGGSGGSVNVLLDWANYGADKKGWALSAELGYGLKNNKADKADLTALTTRVTALEGGSALAVNVTGAGNAITSISKTGTQIIATRDKTFLTQHQSLSHLLRIDGSNGTNAGVNALLNKLNTGSSVPVDDDFYLSQYSGGGTSNTTVVKRKISLLWNYIKGKADSVYLGINAKAVDSDKLDGKHLDEVRKSALAFSTFTGTSTTGGYDLNSLAPDGGIVNNYEGISCWGNAPAGAKYGFALHLTTQYSIGGQLFADINHNDVNDVTRSLWWRASGTVNSAKAWGKWHQIAFTDSTVNNAKSLGGVAADQYLTKSNYTTTLDGQYAKLADRNNLVHSSNEVTFVPSGYSGVLWLNRQTCGGTNGSLTWYYMGNGQGGYAAVMASKFQVVGGTANQFLKADGSVDSNTYLTTLGATLKYLPLKGGTLTGLLTLQHGTDTKLIFNNTDGEKYTVISFREAGTEYSAMRAHEDRFSFNKYIKAPHFIAETTTLCSNLNADLLDGLHLDAVRGYRVNHPAINSMLGVGNAPFNALGMQSGKPMYDDPEFASGTNSVSLYNNANNGNVAVDRIVDNQNSANSSGYILRISNKGYANPALGGFVQNIHSRSNAVFMQIFRAKIPVGYRVVTASNAMGASYSDVWLTSTTGTGKWEWYARMVYCGESGSFSSGGHVYIDGTAGTSSAPVYWYLSHCQLWDLTKGNYSGLRSKFADNASLADAAAKLSDNAPFTAWGQTFFQNGKPKSVSGNMTLGGGHAIIGMDSKHILQDHNNGNVTVGAAKGNLYIGYQNTNNVYFGPDSVTAIKMVILSNGNVGIGTTSPAYKLDVKGDVRASDKIYIGTSGAYLYYDAANGCIRFNKTIVSDGDVQAFGASQTSGGSGGGTAFNLLTSWGGTYDGTYALSARLGVDLNTRLRAVEAAGYLTSITKAMVENVLTGQITTHTHNMLDRPSDTRAVATKPNDYNGAFRFTGMKRCDALGVTSSDTYVNGFGWRGWSDSSGGHAWEIFGDNSSLYVRHGLNTSWDSWQKVLTSANYASVLGSIYQAKGNYALASQLTDGSVTKLGKTNVGASNLPVYLSGGVPKSVGSIGEAFLSWGGKNISGGISPIDCAASNLHSANRLAFAKPEGITVEYSRNGGSSWTDYGANDVQKIKLVSGLGQSFYIGSATSGVTTVYRLRVTLNATQMGVYTYTHKLLLNISTNGASGCKVMLERSMKGSETSFATVGTYDISGWSGWNSILYNAAFGGDSNQTTNVAAIRLTFSITRLHTNKDYNNALTLTDIVVIGSTYWATPSKMARTGHLYDYDAYQNASFPGNITLADGKSVTAPGGFIGALSGNAATATKLQTARKINGTNFDGANDITTAKWGTARNISIADYNSSHTGAGVSVDGSGNVTLKLPPTITASLSGNATTASKWATARIFMVQDYTLNNQGTQVNVDGSGAVSLMMPSAADFSKLNVSTLSAQSASVSTTLSVTGATKLSSTLSVSGGATLSSTLSVAGATTLKSTLSVTNDTTLTALNVKTVTRFRHAGTAAKWIQFEPVAAGSLNIICKTDSGNSSTSFGSFNINGQLDLFKLYIDTSLILGANSRVTGNINMVTAGAKIYLDKDNDAYLYYDRANKCVRTNKTFVSDGDVQAFGASGSAGPNVTYLSISTDGTLNIPAEATDVVIYSTVDGGTVTLKLTGDTSAMTIIRLYVREYSAGDVDIKFDTDKVNVPNGRMTMLSLVKDKNGKIFLAA